MLPQLLLFSPPYSPPQAKWPHQGSSWRRRLLLGGLEEEEAAEAGYSGCFLGGEGGEGCGGGGAGGGGRWVFCVLQKGRRDVMEDRYSALVGLHGDSNQAYFGIFDGHGGAKAAEFAADNLNKNIIDELKRRENYAAADDEIKQAVKSGYLTTDSEFLKRDLRGGACCVTALIIRGNLVVSNAGDCRAVSSRGGVAEALTSDHRPSREDERDRIETLGGFVECRNGVWRVLGLWLCLEALEISTLNNGLLLNPRLKSLDLNKNMSFFCLLLMDYGISIRDSLQVSNQEAVDKARQWCINTNKPQPLTACRKLVDLAVSRGSTDDISVMLIQLGRFC
ncbi:UNVERIFIED_CONTAM: putative protein phosphatase 2C 25 [Sesamum calycinum]|uniref:protein-serine/threonine phosphatase n=1 Tax=Sesamum calycinum TaxID=2727403 RepID=A0AAW2PMU1_9LAMI